MNPYRIFTDATADLPPYLVEELDLVVAHMDVQQCGQTYAFEPTEKEIRSKDFYQKLREGHLATTSQVTLFTHLSCMEPVLQNGEDILYIAFSSGLSGTYQAGCLAAEQLREKYPERKIFVIDSLAASLGEGLLVWWAAQKKREGMSIEELNQWVLDHRLHLVHWFTVDDLNHLKRGGRVSAAAAAFGTVLQIKPVMHVDDEGHLIPVHKAQGRKRSLKGLVDEMKKTAWPSEQQMIFIGHGDCEEDAFYVRDLIKEAFGIEKFVIHIIGPIVGSHSGPGTIALFFLGDHR